MPDKFEAAVFWIIVFVIIMIYEQGGVECCLLVSLGLVFVVFVPKSKEERGGYSKSTVDIDGDGSISDEEWVDFEKEAVFEDQKKWAHRAKVGSKCTEFGCKGKVMYKSKFCYKHRNLK